MKMKWKNALLALFIGGVTLTACSDKGDVIDPDVTPVEQEGDAYLSLKMVSGLDVLLPTKANETEPGDSEENAVDEAMWVLYDAKSLQVKYQFVIAATNNDNTTNFGGAGVATHVNTHTKSFFTTAAEHVVNQDYKLLVVLNPTDAMKQETVKGKYYNSFEAAQTTTVEAMRKSAPNGIFKFIPMTNASGLIDVKKDVDFFEDEETAEKDTELLVQVDRIIAKVMFRLAPNYVVTNGGSFANPKWKLDITNKKTFWVRRLTNVAPVLKTGDPMNTDWENEADKSFPLRWYLYAEDPNWDHFSIDRVTPAGTVNTDRTALAAEFNFEANNTTPDLSAANDLTNEYSREYVLENTMNADEQWEDVTTRILIRGNYVPDAYKDVAETESFVADDSYYFYGGAAFSYTQLKTWHEDVTNDNKNYPWPSAPAGLKAVVEAAYADGFFTAPGSTDGRTASGTHAATNLTYYQGGVSYYTALIRHFSDDYSANNPATPDKMNFGRYGVVRNNVYKVEMTQISGPGSPVIPDPEGPDDKEKLYISTTTEVLPWVIRNQDIDL